MRRKWRTSKTKTTCMTMIMRSRSRQKSFHTLLRLRVRVRLSRKYRCDQEMRMMTVMKGFRGREVNTIRSLPKNLPQTVLVKNRIESIYTKPTTSPIRADAQDKEAVAILPIAIKAWQQIRNNSRKKELLLRKIVPTRIKSGLQAVISSNR